MNILFLLFFMSNAEAVQIAPIKNNCFIQITSTLKTGEKENNAKAFFYKNEKECIKMKKILSENFSPQSIRKVETRMSWQGQK